MGDSALARPLLALLLAASAAVLPGAAWHNVHGAHRNHDIGKDVLGDDGQSSVRENHEIGGKKRFLIQVADARSGSTMLERLLSSHPQVAVWSEEYNCNLIGQACANHENLIQTHRRLSSLAGPRTTWVGFKLMTYHFDNVPGKKLTVFNPQENGNATFIFHFRRNILREIISQSSGHPCHPPWCHAEVCICHDFAHDDTEATKLQKKNLPTLPTDTLVQRIAQKIESQRQLMVAMNNYPGFNRKCISHYEDWINPAVRVAQSNAIITECLGLQASNLTTGLVAVNKDRPVLETVSNPEQVKHALQGTPYAYMLEDTASRSDAFESLLETDVLDESVVHF